MAPEIADSDGEGDIVLSQAANGASHPPTPAKGVIAITDQVSPPGVNFDDFIDPTQTLSGQSPLTSALGLGTRSTEKALRRLANAPKSLVDSSLDRQMGDIEGSSSTMKKRRLSASDGNPTSAEMPGKNKRTKTYGSKFQSGSTIDLYAEADTGDQSSSNMVVSPAAQGEVRGLARTAGVDLAHELNRPRRIISHLDPSKTPGQITTTMSSYGDHQSIDLDFRGGLYGHDVGNPFATQGSVDVEESNMHPDVEVEIMTSPEHPHEPLLPATIDPSGLFHSDIPDVLPTVERPSKRCKTDNLDRGTTASPAPSSRRAASVSAESITSDKPQARKRGRKAKGSKLANTPQPDEMGPPDLPEPPSTRRTRRNTLDSSQMSQDETPSNTKRKRTKSKADMQTAEDTPSKQLRSELNLGDEQLIGLPKENYKPRPSRRRSRQVEEATEIEVVIDTAPSLPNIPETTRTKDVESWPAKAANSELHPSDEQLIGLPKENYKPRPSRRRSRPIEDESKPEAKSAEPLGPVAGQDEPTKDAPVDPEPTPTPAKSAKKGRKSKVKRAKTSAAALLKKSSDMISDGEDDVLWMDTKPATVKLDLPPDLNLLKKEEETTRVRSISIEIPALSPSRKKTPLAEDKEKPAETSTEKKKRGRPKKLPPPSDPALDKAPTPEPLTDVDASVELVVAEAEVEAELDADADVEEDDEDDDICPTKRQSRPVLAARDTNIITSTSTTTKPTSELSIPISPTKPAANKENIPPPTPSPTKPTTAASKPIHSPINPSSAWNSKSRYRVGLTKRASIPSLLRKVDRTKAAPSKVGVKVKEVKQKKGNEDMDSGEEENGTGLLRDKDGNLVEWEF